MMFITDDSGRVRFDGLPSAGLAFEASLGSVVVHQELKGNSEREQALVLRNGGSIRVRLQDDGGVTDLLLAGSNFKAP